MSITNKIVNNAIDYIIRNLNNEITVEDVAENCNFSKFHFSRLFRSETGESVYSFIKRLRMEQSALRLGTNINQTITYIGLDYGYSPSNYSSAFKKHHKITPIKFRNLKKENNYDLKHPLFDVDLTYQDFNYYNDRITIKELKDFSVLFKRYIGSYKDMAIHWRDFIDNYKHLINSETQFIEITYDDPKITDPSRCLYDICLKVDDDNGFDNIKIIKGGKFASYRFEGSVIEIFQAFKGIFNIWMPKSQFELDDRTGFDAYKNADCDNDYFVMDLYIPVR